MLHVLKRSAPQARPESLEIAHWLEGQDVEFYQLAGAMISANNGDPAGLRRVIVQMADDTHPVRKRVRWEMEQLLRRVEGQANARAHEALE